MNLHRGALFVVVGAAVWLGGSGCAMPLLKSAPAGDEKRTNKLVRELRRKNALIEELRERNQILSERVAKQATVQVRGPEIKTSDPDAESVWRIPPGAFSQSLVEQTNKQRKLASVGPIASGKPASAVSTPDLSLVDLTKALPAKKQIQKQEGEWLAGPKPKPKPPMGSAAPPTEVVRPKEGTETGESYLYGQVMKSYRKRDTEALKNAVRLFLKTYPSSVYADNALYLEAMAAIEIKDWLSARATLDQILREYPSGNKAVSAMFAKAVVSRHKGEFAAARSLLGRLMKNYPGSPESSRAELEQKLISQLEKTGRGQ